MVSTLLKVVRSEVAGWFKNSLSSSGVRCSRWAYKAPTRRPVFKPVYGTVSMRTLEPSGFCTERRWWMLRTSDKARGANKKTQKVYEINQQATRLR